MRDRTTKELASRIDPTYVRRQSGQRWALIIASIGVMAAAAGWWYVARTRGAYGAVNPGHVSTAHAMWENDCAKCHDNDGKGGFRAAVSDSACLQCHNAAGHDPSQLLRAGANAHHDLALAVGDGAGGFRSANCVACHVEHKGPAAMSASDDAHCTSCHVNITAALAPGSVRTISQSVAEFNATGSHPFFGRELLAAGAAPPRPPAKFDPATLVDPTHLKFNHGKHMTGEADPVHGAGVNCTTCHVNRNRVPLAGDASQMIEPSDIGDGRYMRPISYARDCESCHKLTLPGGATLPHVAMELVLSQLSHPADFYRDWLARLPDEKRKTTLQGKTHRQWIDESVASLRTSAGEWVGGLEKEKKVMPGATSLETAIVGQFALAEGSTIEAAQAGQDIRVISAYVAYANAFASRCAKCHDVRELQAGSASASSPTSAPADVAAPTTQPVDKPSAPLLSTVPTGIPDSPRRWFRHSTFDHKKHQNMTCLSCHDRAKTSAETRDVLSPNLTWPLASGTTASCADCHHPPDKTGPGAGVNCVTCHVFHDREKSTSPTVREDLPELLPGDHKPPVTQPVANIQN